MLCCDIAPYVGRADTGSSPCIGAAHDRGGGYAGGVKAFDLAEMSKRVAAQGQLGQSSGDAGFVASAKVCAVLVPTSPESYPLAVGVVYADQAKIDPEALLETLRFGVGQSVAPEQDAVGPSTRTLVAV